MIDFLRDVVVYLAIAGALFCINVLIWRRIYRDFRNWADRFLFWSAWIGQTILLAGIYHTATRDRILGLDLMAMALAEILMVLVLIYPMAIKAYSKPYVVEEDTDFMARLAADKRKRDEEFERYRANLFSNDQHLAYLTTDAVKA